MLVQRIGDLRRHKEQAEILFDASQQAAPPDELSRHHAIRQRFRCIALVKDLVPVEPWGKRFQEVGQR